MSQDPKSEFALFIDESGSPKPNPNDTATYFALGGVLVKRADEQLIEDRVKEFKRRWQIDEATPLHGNEIRSKKKKFAWLGKLSDEDRSKFMEDLTNTISSLPITVHACVVSRQGYLDRYSAQYRENTWEMMKSAFSILVDRSVKYIADEGESIMIYYEKAGKREDGLIESYFKEIREKGHPFDTKKSSIYAPLNENELSKYLRGIEGKSKSNEILQIADLCLYPVARSKERPDDKAYIALKESCILIDSRLTADKVGTQGIKYYCFDSTP